MSYLPYLYLFAHSSVQHILCRAFALRFLVLCTLCYQFFWIVHFFIAPSTLLSNERFGDFRDLVCQNELDFEDTTDTLMSASYLDVYIESTMRTD